MELSIVDLWNAGVVEFCKCRIVESSNGGVVNLSNRRTRMLDLEWWSCVVVESLNRRTVEWWSC